MSAVSTQVFTNEIGQHYGITEDLSAKMPFSLFPRPHYELLHALTLPEAVHWTRGGHRRLTCFHIILENLGT
jgi:hypothetical protein